MFSFRPLLGSVMYINDHAMFTMFLNLKFLVFHGSETKDAYDFIVDYYERLHMLCTLSQHGMDFVSFQFHDVSKQWCRAYMECRSSTLPPNYLDTIPCLVS